MPTRCCRPNARSGTALPSGVESVCAAHGFLPERAREAQAALFWDDPGGTSQPPGHWLQIADTVTAAAGSDLLQTARATALAGIAMDDAGIATWETKYNYNSWRPFSAIQDCSGWNANFTTCDASWSSLIATPPHPDYLAGHPAFSGAAATALDAALGTDNIAFTSTSDAYCNAGTTMTDAEGHIIGCTLDGTSIRLPGPVAPAEEPCNSTPKAMSSDACSAWNRSRSAAGNATTPATSQCSIPTAPPIRCTTPAL